MKVLSLILILAAAPALASQRDDATGAMLSPAAIVCSPLAGTAPKLPAYLGGNAVQNIQLWQTFDMGDQHLTGLNFQLAPLKGMPSQMLILASWSSTQLPITKFSYRPFDSFNHVDSMEFTWEDQGGNQAALTVDIKPNASFEKESVQMKFQCK
jgi:hypothetical protein